MNEVIKESCVVIMPEKALWGPFVDIKRHHMNPKITRAPYPHVTLLAPFYRRDLIVLKAEEMRKALTDFRPFTVRFSQLKLFENKKSGTLYFEPEIVEPDRQSALDELFLRLKSKYPDCTRGQFNAHIGVGYFKDKAEAHRLQIEYQKNWQPLEFLVDRLYLQTRTETGPWEIVETVKLGDLSS